MELWLAIQLTAIVLLGLCAWLLGRSQGRGNTNLAKNTLRQALRISGLEMSQVDYSIQELADLAASRITMLEAVDHEA